jgi:Rad3-related DNA helicase
MAKVKKAQFGVSKSDSLMKESNKKKALANTQERIGKAAMAKGKGNESRLLDLKGTSTPTGSQRLEIAKKARAEAKKDSIASVKAKTMKSGGNQMLKRADGSVSPRGLWDNMRDNKGSGKKPTAQMLKQEKKIKAKSKK